MQNIHVCLQVRCSSDRLPCKCLLPINKLESVKVLIKRVKSKKYSVNVLTSNNKSDDYLCDVLKSEKINIFRGDLNNVYKRYIQFSKKLKNEDLIIRITGDNLLIDKNLLIELINFYKKNNYNYVSINREKSKLPYGISVELFNLKTLKKWEAISLYDKEHVTSRIIKKEQSQGYFIKQNNENFYNLRCTLDDIKDYFIIKTVFEKAKSFKLDYLKMCKILNNIKKKEILVQRKNYSNIILGSAQFDGKYGIANSQKLKNKNIDQILNIADEIGINQIDTAYAYKGVHDKIIKSSYGKKFNIISKGSLNFYKNNSFIKEFNETSKKFNPNKLRYFLIHNFSEYNKNLYKFDKIIKNNKFLKKKLGISIYSPDELKEINEKIFRIIQIPFNLCDMRWKNIKFKNKIIIRSIFLQGIFFCKNRDIPIKIRPEVQKIKNKINFLVRKFKRFDTKDLLLNYVKHFNFKGIIVGVDSEKQLKELFFYINRPQLKTNEVREIKKIFKVPSNVVDPRKWY
ncbi:aldo/keto reductase [Candidatus Pelagibacter sp.]|nr:aldo/keto reductase [Candidatus Pelagibacter sp.]